MRRRVCAAIILCMACVVHTTSASPNRSPAPAALEVAGRLASASGARITWDTESGTPQRIDWAPVERVGAAVRELPPRDLAISRMQEIVGLFGFGEEDVLEPTETSELHGMTKVIFEQRHAGLPVFGCGYAAIVGAQGTLEAVSGRAQQAFTASATPILPRAAVLGRARLGAGRGVGSDDAVRRLGWLPLNGAATLAYEVVLSGPGYSRSVFVSANDGSLLSDADMLLHPVQNDPGGDPPPESGGGSTMSWTINATAGECGAISPSGAVSVTEGESKTFSFIPTNSHMFVYKVIVDNVEQQGPPSSYTFSNVTAPHTIEVRFKTDGLALVRDPEVLASPGSCDAPPGFANLAHLELPATNLKGQYVWAREEERGYLSCDFQQSPPASRTTADTTRYDEVFAYHHIDRFISNYLVFQLSDASIVANAAEPYVKVVTRFGTNSRETHYDPVKNEIALTDGDYWANPGAQVSLTDMAKDIDVMVHETGHRFLRAHNITGPTLPDANHETWALHEGLSDLLAADYSGSPALGECSIRGLTDQRNCANDPLIFNYDNRGSCSYPPNYPSLNPGGGPHAKGMIVSGLLWDIRQIVGVQAFRLILSNTIFRLFNAPTFNDLRAAIDAEVGTLSPEQRCAIAQVMYARRMPGSPATLPPPPVPDSPSLQAGTGSSRCAVRVSWNPVAGANRFKIYRDGGTNPAYDTSDYSVTDVGAEGAPHTYQVSAYNSNSPLCPSAKSAPTAWSPLLPPAPSVTATDGLPDHVDVSWTSVTGYDGAAADGYHVYRAARGSAARTLVHSAGATETSWTDDAVPDGIYVYSVAAYVCSSADGPGGSDEGHKAGPPMVASINGPTTLASGSTGTWTVTVGALPGAPPYYSWSYYLDCPEPGGPGNPVTEEASLFEVACWTWYGVGLNAPAWSKSSVWDFRVRCVVSDDLGRSATVQRNVDIPGVEGAGIDAPANFAASDGAGSAVVMTWEAVPGAAGYRITRDGTEIATPAQNAVSYSDAAPSNAIHTYCIRAYSGAIQSGSICDQGHPASAPPSIVVNGPTSLGSGQSGTFTGSYSGGMPPLTVEWWKYRDCPGEVNPSPPAAKLLPTCWLWIKNPFQPGATLTASDEVDFVLSATVTDALGRTAADLHCVDVSGSFGRDGCGISGPVPNSPAVAASTQPAFAAEPAPTLTTAAPPTAIRLVRSEPRAGAIRVELDLQRSEEVSLVLYDIAGRQVARLIDGVLGAGSHRLDASSQNLNTGFYLYRFRAGAVRQAGRVLVVR